MPPIRLPRITWGAGFANVLDFAYPLDEALSWSEPRRGIRIERFPSGEEDCWVPPTDHFLSGAVRWIEPVEGLGIGPVATPWHGAAGVRAWLASAQNKQTFRWYPDRVNQPGTYLSCYLVEPASSGAEPVELEEDLTRKIKLVLRSSSEFTGY